MKEFFPVLHTAALFSGISDDELAVMLSYLGARIDTFPKGSRLLRAGEQVEEVGSRAGGQHPHCAGGYLGKPQHPLQDRAGADLQRRYSPARRERY